MALRLAGCGCVFVSALMWCVQDRAVQDRVMEAYSRVLRFIAFVRREIEFYETPFPRIAAKFSEREGDLDVSCQTDTVEALGAALSSALAEADRARFLSFYGEVGGNFSETELRACDEASQYFGERLASLKEELGQKKRVRSALTVFAAATVCILVL